jgi:hypothetical protein
MLMIRRFRTSQVDIALGVDHDMPSEAGTKPLSEVQIFAPVTSDLRSAALRWLLGTPWTMTHSWPRPSFKNEAPYGFTE